MSFIAIDLGATYVKSCLIDSETYEISSVNRIQFPSNETDFEVILHLVRTALEALLLNIGPCSGVFFSNQMHGLLLADGHGNIVSPFLSWQNQQCNQPVKGGVSSFEQLKELTRDFSWNRETGEYLRVGFPITQLFHLKSQGQVLDGVMPIDLGNAIAAKLAGAKISKIDPTNAAAMGCYHLASGQWHHALLFRLGLDHLIWPSIEDPNSIHGFYDFQKQRIPIYLSVGDQQVSLLGAGLNKPFQISCNIATGSQVSILSAELSVGEFQVRPFFGKYLKTITHIPAGRSLNAIVKLLVELNPVMAFDEAWNSVADLVDKSIEKDLRVNLAFFNSAFGCEGSISGITEQNLNVGELMRASLKEISAAHLRGFHRFDADPSLFTEVLGSGGVLRKSLVLQNYIKIDFRKPLTLPPRFEDALAGSAERARLVR